MMNNKCNSRRKTVSRNNCSDIANGYNVNETETLPATGLLSIQGLGLGYEEVNEEVCFDMEDRDGLEV
jgi:hypothetical protein